MAAGSFRARRSCLTVPGSSEKFLARARSIPADEIILDLEDSVAVPAKDSARERVAHAAAQEWHDRLLAVRVNAASTQWAYRDVIDVVHQAGPALRAIVLPKVSGPDHVIWLDLLLTQLERALALPAGAIAIEAQIEDAAGLAAADQIAAAAARMAALIFGPGDFMASIGMRALGIGAHPAGYPGDAFGYPLMRILVAARAHGLQAIDGPYAAIGDIDGLSRSAASSAALGYDGKWVLHPDQVGPVNAAFAPDQDDYDRAELILDACDYYADVLHRGAAMLDGEMIDEASRKLALVAAARGRAAGLRRTRAFTPSA